MRMIFVNIILYIYIIMKKILFWAPCNLNIMCGITTITNNMLKILSKNNEVHFLSKFITNNEYKNQSIKYLKPMIYNENILHENEKLINIINDLDNKNKYDIIILRTIDIVKNKLYLKINNLKKIYIYVHNPFLKINIEDINNLYKKCGGILCSSDLCKNKFINIVNNNKNIITFFPCIENVNNYNNKKFEEKNIIKILYTGSFKKGYCIKEIIESIIKINSKKNKNIERIELHMYGNIYKGYNKVEIKYINDLINKNKNIIYKYDPLLHDTLIKKFKNYDFGISFRGEWVKNAVDISSKILEYSNEGLPVILNSHSINIDAYGQEYPCYIQSLDNLFDKINQLYTDKNLYQCAIKNGYEACQKYSFEKMKNNINNIYINDKLHNHKI